MGTRNSQARFPKRVTVQMSGEMNEQLRQVANRDYSGNLQALMRETLQARVDGDHRERDHLAEVLRALDQVRQANGQNLELERGVVQLLEDSQRLMAMVGAQQTEIMATREALTNLEKHFTKLEEDFARRTDGLSEQVGQQSSDIKGLLTRVAGHVRGATELLAEITSADDDIPSDERRGGIRGLFSRRRTTGE